MIAGDHVGILEDPRVALFFLVPGIGETMRVNGRATISVDPMLLERFTVNQKKPRAVIVVRVDAVFFQCSKAYWVPSSGSGPLGPHTRKGTERPATQPPM